MKINRELILAVAVSFVLGALVGAAAKITVSNGTATARDIIDSYLRGQRDALSTKTPTAELEAACANLWITNQQRQK
jgi:hypothetical protein